MRTERFTTRATEAIAASLMWSLYAPGLAIGAALGSTCYLLLLLWNGLSKRIGKAVLRNRTRRRLREIFRRRQEELGSFDIVIAPGTGGMSYQ